MSSVSSIYVGDFYIVYGSELKQAVHANFRAMGGEFDKYVEKLGYAPRTGHLAASLYKTNFIMWDSALKVLESRLQSAISQYGIDKVSIYMVSLDEVTPLFIQALESGNKHEQ